MCGIKHVYLKSGWHSSLKTTGGNILPRLALILNSVKRLQGPHTRTILPITFPVLNQIYQRLVDCLIETICIIALFLHF